jgi:membrane-associated phospholipid phosphatase
MGLRLAFVISVDLVLTFLLKICFYAFGGSTELNILSPSGHASFSVAVYGCCAVVLANKRCLAERVLIVGTTVIVVLTIIASRIILHAHTSEEAVVGSLVGGICVAVFSTGGSRLQKFQLRLPIWVLVVLMIGTVSAWAVGRRVHTERLIEHWGIKIGSVWDES